MQYTHDLIILGGGSAGPTAKLMFVEFMLAVKWFTTMDSGHVRKFSFSEAISLLVRSEDQEEIDALWGKLSAVSDAEQCGWMKDKYGVSWQISAATIDEMMK